jgi:hypothetical protein
VLAQASPDYLWTWTWVGTEGGTVDPAFRLHQLSVVARLRRTEPVRRHTVADTSSGRTADTRCR